jgi:class 3 adenylate cyclase/alpha-beta hydrolase superfamily lysophospholipase
LGAERSIDRRRGIRDAVAVEVPETRFAHVGEDRVAYQVFGEGPDVVYMSGTTETIDLRWEWPPYALFLRRLASFSRVVTFDQRGQGGSDRVSRSGVPAWEDWAEDARAVLDAVGSQRSALFATIETTPIALLLAATEPERTQSLILFGGTARFAAAEDYPGLSPDAIGDIQRVTAEAWGTDEAASMLTPALADDPAYRRWFAKSQRAALSPRDAAAVLSVIGAMDVRQVLASVRTPALVIHRKGSHLFPVDQSRYLAEHLPDARFVLSDGDDLNPWSEPMEEVLDEIERFLTGSRDRAASTDRVLATVLFTDIVGSTQRAATQGDRHWRTLLESHDTITRGVIDQHGGRVIKLTGDGVLATFDGPGRAVLCARSLREALVTLGINIRAGMHTGEIEIRGDDIGGIAVHVASRVKDHADSGEIWVSGAVPLLMVGSNVEFEPRGEWTLKGVPGNWQLHTVRT